MTSNQNLSEKIIALREMLGLSYTELSVETGIPKSTLQRAATGKGVNLATVDLIAEKTNLSVSALLSDEIPADQMAIFVQLIKGAKLFTGMEEPDLEKLVGHIVGISEVAVKYYRKKQDA